MPFIARILLFEKPPDILHLFNKAHTLLQIGTVGALVPLDVTQAAVLLRLPFGNDLFVECRVPGGRVERNRVSLDLRGLFHTQ